MKYIRTKNEIYEVDRLIVIKNDISNKVKAGKYYETNGYIYTLIPDSDIKKQSDTIKELCDRYVGVSNNKPMIIKYEFGEYYDEYNGAYTKEELLAMYDAIYGAIWTDKGLIYVAKMNEKGELELI